MTDHKSLVALLPMKANSERVRGKNFRDLAGRPLYQWVLDTLLKVAAIDQVVINTDAHDELEETGFHRKYEGARVIIRDRHEAIRGDHVSMNLILADDIAAVPAERYLMTHVTNPLLSAETVGALVSLSRSAATTGHDSVFTVNTHHTRFYDGEGRPINHDPDNLIRTQDLPPYHEENSVAYLFTAESFATTGARIGKRPVMHPTPALESIDIDDPADWYMAESLALRGPLPPMVP